MPTILERLRQALAPDYEVERELSRGGMGMVFLARDVTLQCPVAIKIVRPELTTANAAQRFLKEARILASLKHPNIVPIHKAGESDGFLYYIMDYLDGQTLEQRLRDGPLSKDEVLALGQDLLQALSEAHKRGVIHRDVKPANVFLMNGRAVLSDFGISKIQDATSYTEGLVVGTRGYMPPEQALGGQVTPRTDIYAAAMVLFESYTQRRWTAIQKGRPNWTGVPAGIIPILRRALAWEPENRWPDAQTFRNKLLQRRTRRDRRRGVLLTVAGLLVGTVIGWIALRPQPALSEVAIVPFEWGSGLDSTVADGLTLLAEINLREFTTIAPSHEVRSWWNSLERSIDDVNVAALRSFPANHFVVASIELDGTDTTVVVEVLDRRGRRQFAGTERLDGVRSLYAVGNRLGLSVAKIVDPPRQAEYRGSILPENDRAVAAYLDGLSAFRRNAFATATASFERALGLDSTFAIAVWWLSNAHRWKITGEPHPAVDLAQVLSRYSADLPTLELLLIQAQLAADQHGRIGMYQRAIEQSPRDAYTTFLYAEELQSRGPFIGVPLEESTRQLELAVEKDSTLGPAVGQLLWAYIRLGREEEARRTLMRYTFLAAGAGPGELEVDQAALLQFAVTERFSPEEGRASRNQMLQQPALAENLGKAIRLAPMFDLPTTLVGLAEQFLATNPPPPVRANLHEAMALGLVPLGRISEAFAHFDTASAMIDVPHAHVEAAEWRVIASALGVNGVSDVQVDAAVQRLESLVTVPFVSARAQWALGLNAAAKGELLGAQLWLDSLRNREAADSAAHRLGTLLSAVILSSSGQYEQALAESAGLLAFDSAGRGGDPFARAVLHLERAEWLDSLGRSAAADSARLWYEHFDWPGGFPRGLARAHEIDWALSSHARWLRANAAARRGDRQFACRQFRRVLELWMRADQAYASQRERAEEYVRNSC